MVLRWLMLEKQEEEWEEGVDVFLAPGKDFMLTSVKMDSFRNYPQRQCAKWELATKRV